MTFRVLVTDEIDAEGVATLRVEPALVVDETPTLPVAELLERIPDYDAIVGRSATRISAELLRRGTKLRVVGRAGVGVDNIALDTATELGIGVINAPAGNTVAVAELFFGALIGLLRHLSRADNSMKEGGWDRSSLLGGELRGRTLGIVGLGRIGGEVAVRAAAFGMNITAYDPYVSDSRFSSLKAKRTTTLEELLDTADILTVHTPLTEETSGMIGRRELGRLSTRSYVVNMARGGVIDEEALLESLVAGKLGGAAIDAFTHEPLPADDPLRRVPNVFLTPHIGASTAEAQKNVAVDVCIAVRDALLAGELSRSINVAAIEGGEWKDVRQALSLARRSAAVARAILASQGAKAIQRVDVRCGSKLAGAGNALLASAAMGILGGVTDRERLNLINARALAAARGIEMAIIEAAGIENPEAIEIRASAGMQEVAVAGIAPSNAVARLTRVGAFHVDIQPRGTLLILTNKDVPGVIGRVGTLLGSAGVNIAEYHQARLAQGGQALAAVTVDGQLADEIRESLLSLPDVLSAAVIRFESS